MNFNDAINEIMPLVADDSDLPFAITHEGGKWNINYFALNTTTTQETVKEQAAEYLAVLREKDPYAVSHTGADFTKGSFSYVCDKVFCARLHAENEVGAFGRANRNELNALINAVENTISAFSQQTINYLLDFDQPLRALYELNPIPLYNRDNPDGAPYDVKRIDDFIEAVESKIMDLIERPNVEPAARTESDNTERINDAKTNQYDTKHTITSLLLNGVEIELGEDTENSLPFYVENNRGGENIFSFRTDNYPEALKIYTGQILDYVHEMSLDRDNKAVKRGVNYIKLAGENCLPDSKNADFTGKLIIVDANSLLPEYRSSTSQLVQCSHGAGARNNAIGTSVFGREIFSGESVVYGRHQILGIADNEKLPTWAKNKLERECALALNKEIGAARTPGEMSGTATYNLKGALDRLNFDYGAERVSAVLAAVVILHDSDGRYSQANKKWAESVQNPPIDMIKRCEINTHPIILNGLVDKVREGSTEIREKKPDFLGKINDNKRKVERDKPNADAPTHKKKRDGQEV